MNRIDKCFEELKAQGRKALITFVTAGDPDLETTEKAVLEMFDKGADIVELGVPFSDPVAEGESIQRASIRSLSGGTNLVKILDMIKNIRTNTDKPLVLMMYINTIFVYGTEKFFTQCAEYGIDGVIMPDLPYEERDEVLEYADRHGVYTINILAPASHGRIKKIASDSKGFIYSVLPAGNDADSCGYEDFLNTIKENASCPFAADFAVSDPEQAGKIAALCDGMIISPAVVDIMEKHGRDSVPFIAEYTAALRKAL